MGRRIVVRSVGEARASFAASGVGSMLVPMWTWAVLGAAAVALLLVTALTAARPAGPVPDRDGYFDRWAATHGGFDPRGNRWAGGWLTVAYGLARPLARWGVKPDVLTVWTVLIAGVVAALATEGGRWPVAAGVLVVTSGLGDAVDGAVAVLTDRTTRWGYVLDSLVDRVNDLLYVAAVWLIGAPAWLVAGTAVGILLLEYVRARGNNAGAGEIGVVTVGERPSRVIACAVTLLAAGVAPAASAEIAAAGLGVLAALTLVGLAQILVAVHRALRRESTG